MCDLAWILEQFRTRIVPIGIRSVAPSAPAIRIASLPQGGCKKPEDFCNAYTRNPGGVGRPSTF